MAVEESETTPTAVKTYIPEYQRDIWDDHAEELEMSRSEFVRNMVQAGRRGFNPGDETAQTDATDAATETQDRDTDESLKERVVEHLAEEPRSWNQLYEALTDDIETRLQETLRELQEENRVQHNGREGGYVLLE